MNNKLIKSVSVTVASLLLVGLAAGCAKEDKQASTATASGSTTQVKEPVNLNFVINNSGRKYMEGTDANNNDYIKYIREKSGFNLRLNELAADGYQDKLNVLLASGEQYDLIHSRDVSWVTNLAKQKAILPLNDLIDKFAPDIKKSMPPEIWDRVTFDGKIYALPGISTKLGDEIMYVRKDWLDKLGLQPPKTLDEYTKVMKAFAEQDPDGNGKADTIGMLIGEKLARSGPYFGAFGVPIATNEAIKVNNWVERNGELVNAVVLPETKQALKYMAELYKQKTLDQEWALNKSKNIGEKIVSGKVGIYSATWFDTKEPTVILGSKKNDPKAEWISLPYPVGSEGKSGVGSKNPVVSYMVIPAKSTNAESTIKLLNFIAKQENWEAIKLGLPEHNIWNRKDGKLSIDIAAHEKHIYRNVLVDLGSIWDADLEGARLDATGLEFKMNENINIINKNVIANKYTGSPTPALAKYGVKLNQQLEETFTKIIMGTLPLDDFDKFTSQFLKDGGEELTKEVNEWYKVNKKK
ncbi:extracellular solute-binding protein [Paenibacillus oryzisoli]|uniref:Peptide permease n=1 Tax=Paenibacillus oryzisoli TaxID=1850517 RepID=A0A197ZZX1_9BACL|nr:extracellular solute-binding protein [Paenibacillus oryzisoli]OAS14402.1 peptide permease [Paenibacillus oryzisoli]